ncbi:MAG: hypothetical protein Tp1124SUR272871_23 [Prokaryotic dsDNA virus sp.]|nr:MAG: hypothetical protein Tp1125SUR00d2C35834131_15 [Prokaryotic dsDNA virus sp.]QDP67343.1 MAG: hypothetical protein Tp1124SUR272871_23 [Prokaryotic dsDNA virus sp.]|tara:strand:+ start:431 stop:673 length:243 start_codon:yes stop_codon:yes gene_type:complete
MAFDIKNLVITKITTKKSYYNEKTKKHVDYKNPKITKSIVYTQEDVYDGFQLVEICNFWKKQANPWGDEVEVKFNILEDY